MNRDELARHLYIHAHDEWGAPKRWQDAGAVEWGEGMVTDDDRDDCYARADQMIRDGEVPL